MVPFAGECLYGVFVGGQGFDAGVHGVYLALQAGHFLLLVLHLDAGFYPRQHAVVGKEQQPQRNHRRDNYHEGNQVVVLFLLEGVPLYAHSPMFSAKIQKTSQNTNSPRPGQRLFYITAHQQNSVRVGFANHKNERTIYIDFYLFRFEKRVLPNRQFSTG